jgi:hypothetical protein
MTVLKSVMKGRGEVGTGKEGRRGREEVGGWGLVALSLSGAVLPTDPVMNRAPI